MTSELSQLVPVLQQALRFIHPAKEQTLFNLGGRGYYENPASDLLAFFLDPQAEHGLGSLFLQAFLDCMNLDARGMSFAGISISREVKTPEGNRIDLLLQGPEWVLLIENKVYHGQVNPFVTYQSYGRALAGDKKLSLAILAPAESTQVQGWVPVSYAKFCARLRQGLAQGLFDRGYSKWLIFAREFILHLENEIYQHQTVMTEQEADFVEQNAEAIARVKKLSYEYRQFVLDTLRERLGASLPRNLITTKDDGWAVRCFSDKWGRSNLAFWSKTPDATGKKFQMTVYLVGLDETQLATAKQKFLGMKYWTEGTWSVWQTQPGFDSRQEGLVEACRLAAVIDKLFPDVLDPRQPEESRSL